MFTMVSAALVVLVPLAGFWLLSQFRPRRRVSAKNGADGSTEFELTQPLLDGPPHHMRMSKN